MIRREILTGALLSLVLLACGVSTAFASDEAEAPTASVKNEGANTGSAASFDQRLPPVIPGEQIQHNGRRTRVWSTSGPVPVGSVPPAPQPPTNGGQINGLPSVGVIVDNRLPDQSNRPNRPRQ